MRPFIFVLLVAAAFLVMIVAVLMLIRRFHRKLRPGQALVITSASGRQPRVRFTGALVLPILQRADLIDITTKIVELELDGDQALVTKDGVRVGVQASFYVRVNHTAEDVLRVATHLGCERASDPQQVAAFFRPKCVDALRQTARQLELERLQNDPNIFRDQVIQVIGMDLGGFQLEDAAIVRIDRAVNRPADEVGPFR